MFKNFLTNRKGQVFSEYGLMIVIVVLLAAVIGYFFRGEIKVMLTNTQSCISTTMGGGNDLSGCQGSDNYKVDPSGDVPNGNAAPVSTDAPATTADPNPFG